MPTEGDGELERLTFLRSLCSLDTGADPALDSLTQFAKEYFETPIALVSLVDETRQWFKSSQGLSGVTETPRSQAFCDYAIQNPNEVLVIENATEDTRTCDNPLVTAAPHIRFYAGAPIVVEGHAVGTLCVIDKVPRKINVSGVTQLKSLAAMAATVLLKYRDEGRGKQHPLDQEHYLQAEFYRLFKDRRYLDAFFDSASVDGLWLWDLENPTEEWMSPAFWTTLGYDPSDMPHKAEAWQHIINPDDLKTAQENFAKHCADPGHPYDQLVRYTHKDGSTVYIRCRGFAIRDTDGKPTRMLGVHTDVTERERVLDSTQARLHTVLDTATSGILAFNEAGVVLSANRQARHILGGVRETEPFAWPTKIVFVDAETAEPLTQERNPINRAIAGQTLRGEIALMKRVDSDAPRYVRVSSSPVSAERTLSDGVVAVVVLDDVSEQEKHRQQVERSGRLDALGQLTGGIAHDFNNLLATIEYSGQLAQIRLAKQGVSDVDEYLDIALKTVRRGADLTRRLLAFAKRQPGLSKSHEVGGLLTDFARLTGPTIEESINLETLVEGRDLWVYCDAAQLENALLNLVLNSRDAILREGKGNQIVVKVRGISEIDADVVLRKETPHTYIAKGLKAEHALDVARRDDLVYRYIEFAVTDNGPGMTDEVKQRAIDPFFTTKATNSGTGLGLSMVYGFIQQSIGELRIYSEVGHGTTVRLILPRGTAAGLREEPVERLPAMRGDGQRVLVVEDEEPLLTIMCELIEALEYKAVPCRSGSEALSLLEGDQEIDVLLTDVVMPGGIGGFDLGKKARAVRPSLPLLYMSGYTGFSDNEMGSAVAPLVQKPCSPAELAGALRAVLERAE